MNIDSFFTMAMKQKKSDKHQRIIQAATKIIAQKGFFQAKVSKEKDIKGKLEKFALTHLQLIENNIDIAEIIQIELRRVAGS